MDYYDIIESNVLVNYDDNKIEKAPEEMTKPELISKIKELQNYIMQLNEILDGEIDTTNNYIINKLQQENEDLKNKLKYFNDNVGNKKIEYKDEQADILELETRIKRLEQENQFLRQRNNRLNNGKIKTSSNIKQIKMRGNKSYDNIKLSNQREHIVNQFMNLSYNKQEPFDVFNYDSDNTYNIIDKNFNLNKILEQSNAVKQASKYTISKSEIKNIINGTFNIEEDLDEKHIPHSLQYQINRSNIKVQDIEVDEQDLIDKLNSNPLIERKGWWNKSFTPGKEKNRINQLAKIKDKCFTKGKGLSRQEKRELYGKDIKSREIQKITLGDLQAISNMKGIFECCQ